MFGKFLNTLMSTPQYKYNIKFSKGRSERCERKQKRNEFNERNAGTQARILFLIYIPEKEQKQQPAISPGHYF